MCEGMHKYYHTLTLARALHHFQDLLNEGLKGHQNNQKSNPKCPKSPSL